MPLYLLFDDHVAVRVKRPLIIGRAHDPEQHLTLVDDIFGISNKNVSEKHIEVVPTDSGLKLRQLGSNKSYFKGEPMLQNSELVVQSAGDVRLKSSAICKICDGDLIFDALKREFKNLQHLEVRDRLDFNDRDILKVLEEQRLETLILDSSFFQELQRHETLDINKVMPRIPPANVDLGLLKTFTYFQDICGYFESKGITDLIATLNVQTPLQIFRLNRSKLLEGLNVRGFSGLFGAALSEKSAFEGEKSVDGWVKSSSTPFEIDAPDAVVRLCLMLADTRELEEFSANAPSEAPFSISKSENDLKGIQLGQARLELHTESESMVEKPNNAFAPEQSCAAPSQLLFRKINMTTEVEKPASTEPLEFSMSSESSDNIFRCKTMKITGEQETEKDSTILISETPDAFAAKEIANQISLLQNNTGSDKSEAIKTEDIRRQSSEFAPQAIAKELTAAYPRVIDNLNGESSSSETESVDIVKEEVAQNLEIKEQTIEDGSVAETPLPFFKIETRELTETVSGNNSTDFRRSTSIEAKAAIHEGVQRVAIEPPQKKVFPISIKQLTVTDGDCIELVSAGSIVADFQVVVEHGHTAIVQAEINNMTLDDFIE